MTIVEHSERGRYVTEQVAVWIENDGEHIGVASRAARLGGENLALFLREVIDKAPDHSAPWHVRQEMAPNDWVRVDWEHVASRIKDMQ